MRLGGPTLLSQLHRALSQIGPFFFLKRNSTHFCKLFYIHHILTHYCYKWTILRLGALCRAFGQLPQCLLFCLYMPACSLFPNLNHYCLIFCNFGTWWPSCEAAAPCVPLFCLQTSHSPVLHGSITWQKQQMFLDTPFWSTKDMFILGTYWLHP